jgi:threonyl-tRNA synthetase
MEYVDRDGEKKRPIIIHRSSIGCYERTLAMLIEKYAGAFPVWLAPVQAKILPIVEKHHKYALDLEKKLKDAGVRVETDLRNEKVGYKIREAQLEKVPYMLITGDREAADNAVSARSRNDGDLGSMSVDDFLNRITKEIADRVI